MVVKQWVDEKRILLSELLKPRVLVDKMVTHVLPVFTRRVLCTEASGDDKTHLFKVIPRQSNR